MYKAILSFYLGISFFFGFTIFIDARSSVHETLGAIFFLISAVSLAGIGIIVAIEKNLSQKEQSKKTK